MTKVGQVIVLALFVGLVLAIVAPGVIFTNRLMGTWTEAYTAQLLGGFLGICGGTLAIVGVLVGAGLFARLAGWRAPKQTPELPTWEPHGPPPIEGQWRTVPPIPPEPAQLPPWGATGGGHFDLLPPPQQDRRFGMDTPSND